MKYYVIEIATGDSKIAGKSINEFATLKEAEATFHSKLGIAMKSDLYKTDLVFVVNSVGGVYANLNKCYVAEVAEESKVTE